MVELKFTIVLRALTVMVAFCLFDVLVLSLECQPILQVKDATLQSHFHASRIGSLLCVQYLFPNVQIT